MQVTNQQISSSLIPSITEASPADKAKEADIVFVGGGPVGLFCAIQAKLRDPNIAITIVEKNEVYKRAHTLKLSPSAFEGLYDTPEIAATLARILGVKTLKDFTSTRHVATLELEQNLKKLALDLGINISHNKVEDVGELKKKFLKANIFVGAEGSHSVIRKQAFFEEEVENKKKLQYLVQAKFNIQSPYKLNRANLKFGSSTARTVVNEHVGETKSNSPVAINFFIDKKEYATFKENNINFANPFELEIDNLAEIKGFNASKKIPEGLKPSIERVKGWLERRNFFSRNEQIIGPVKITATELNVYSAKNVVRHEENEWYKIRSRLEDGKPSIFYEKVPKSIEERNVTWVLVGDAAAGVPFWQSLHNGFKCASYLAKTIILANKELAKPAENLSNRNISVQQAVNPNIKKIFDRYSQFFQKKAYIEILKAKVKSLFISFLCAWYKFWGTIKSFLLCARPYEFVPLIQLNPEKELSYRNTSYNSVS